MPRINQLTPRQAALQRAAQNRGVSVSRAQPKILPRSRFMQQDIQEKRELEKTKKEVAKLSQDIGDGKKKNISEIPLKYRKYIKVTQAQLNQIRSYHQAKAYEAAYNQVMRHYRKGMLWAVAAFGEGLERSIAKKLIKQGYAPSKLALEREQQSRRDALQQIRAGTIKGVKIVGNRIMDSTTGKPITIGNAFKKQAAAEITKTLPKGDKLILDKTYTIKAISSGVLGQSIPYTQKALESYSKRVSQSPLAVARKQPTFKEIIKSRTSSYTVDLGSGLKGTYNPKTKKIQVNPKGGKSTFYVSEDATTILPRSKTGLSKDIYLLDGNIVSSVKYVKETKKVSREFKQMLKDYTYDIKNIKSKIRNNKNTTKSIAERVAQIKADNPGLSAVQMSNKIEKELNNKAISNTKNLVKSVGELAIKSAAVSIVGLGFAIPGGIAALRRDPIGTISKLPSAAVTQVKNDFNTVMSGDVLNILQLGVEYYTVGKLFQGVGKATKGGWRLAARLSPRYVRLVGSRFVIRKAPASTFKVRGKTRYLKTRVQRPSFKRPFSSVADFLKGRKPGQFKKFTKDPGLILRETSMASGATKPLSQQAQLVGQEVTAVNAAANQLTSWLKRKNIVRKPLNLPEKKFPLGEASLPKRYRNILNKFDAGKKLTTKEFADINIWLQKNGFPNTTLLERSLYADPASGVRASRLMVKTERTATLKDILKGNFKLWSKSSKPQILIFENAKVAKFPKSLKGIERKLKMDKTLTQAETLKLIKWQTQTGSGKFKPIGSTIYNRGKELEITLAPRTMIKRIKQVGFTYIKGKKLTFVTAKPYIPTKAIAKQIKLANVGKLAKGKIKALEKLLSKKLGRKIRVETPSSSKAIARQARRASSNIPVLRIKAGKLFVVPLRKVKIAKRKVKVSKKTTSRKTVSVRRTSKTKRVVRSKAKRVARKTPKRPVRKTPKRVTPKRPSKRTSKKVTKRPSKRPSKRTSKKTTTKRPPKRPTTRIPPKTPTRKKPPVRLSLNKFPTRKLSRAVPVYYIMMKVRGKKVKLVPKPLTLKDAKDYLAYKVDNGLSRTAWFEPIGVVKEVKGLPKPIQGYYSKNKRKLRPYKIRVGKKKLLRNGFIEKNKFIQDTPGEKRAIKRIKAKKKTKRPVKRVKRRVVKRKVVKRRTSPTNRKKMLANLKKARAARKRKRK